MEAFTVENEKGVEALFADRVLNCRKLVMIGYELNVLG